jgi:hypothetical protein
MNMKAGQKVEIVNTLPQNWFRHLSQYPSILTGTVQKVFKNGKVAVAMDQLPMRGGDGKRTIHFDGANVVEEMHGWVPVDDPNAWKANDAALIAARRAA